LDWQPHRRRARFAATLGWLALALIAISASTWLYPLLGGKGVGREFAIGVWSSLIAVVVAMIAVMANAGAIYPRSRAPLIALLLALPLAAFNVYVAIVLAGLANMH
jgi:hypothetical protein